MHFATSSCIMGTKKGNKKNVIQAIMFMSKDTQWRHFVLHFPMPNHIRTSGIVSYKSLENEFHFSGFDTFVCACSLTFIYTTLHFLLRCSSNQHQK